MENPRLDSAVNLLKQCRSQGKTYYEATQLLTQQGFTQSEIEQASYQFQYDLNDNQKQNPPLSSLSFTENDIHEIELQQAKDQLSRDYWYSFIPIVGAYYKTKRINDYTKYESLKTGRDPLTVLAIWFVAMIIGTIFALIVGPGLVGLFTKNNTALYLSHYIGVIVAVLLLYFIFRTRKQ